jgi:transcriptional regulator of arginine metabolism
MKDTRQKRIIELITSTSVHTQTELADMLRAEGFKVTQATISRDIKVLGLEKRDGSNSYKLKNSAETGIAMANSNISVAGSIISIRHSLNNVVVKTLPGLSHAVAAIIDSSKIEGVLGCVAGDDTIIVVTSDAMTAEGFSSKLQKVLKYF